ncbi:MAG: hypothetical protein WA755_01735 [Candidatus Acidiferrales bacterium]
MSRQIWKSSRWLPFAAALILASSAVAQQEGPPPPGSPPAATTPAPPAPASPATPAAPAPSENAPTSAAPSAAPAPSQPSAPVAAPAKIELPIGTRLPLVLHNGISTRTTRVGDPVYFETIFPVMLNGKVIIPAGSYVSGEVTESKRPGRVKGRGEIMLRLETLILPNAYMVKFNGSPSDASTGGNETTDREGKIVGDTDKTSDAGTIAKTTAAGAGVGGLATRSAGGALIGAGIGAVAGLTAVLLTRGPETELPRGTTLDAVLDRPLVFDADKIQFTSLGQSSTIPGPPSREPERSKVPF